MVIDEPNPQGNSWDRAPAQDKAQYPPTTKLGNVDQKLGQIGAGQPTKSDAGGKMSKVPWFRGAHIPQKCPLLIFYSG
jgi:hypothetical protein